jgi:hypothetical protein
MRMIAVKVACGRVGHLVAGIACLRPSPPFREVLCCHAITQL